ncbi:hypothetical protein LAUMK191_03402 [Mycobacterium attenuatum]|uniref:Uncharacterized protein n=1 Tax=Mycobacterium attenuatum TaxID=2341086 RepID=A0A498Q8Z7_9MYCO|nr:hypothetical protein LAUMK136_03429 [Mycobacterium attenuatum]VBA55606.1 hypothetical protein LAUMK191_03402 [Mycobacterium attenuatum]VBA59469.1 hypothetical protein LAUMK41_03500 [Mycobacterium attenuatum]
MHAIDNQWCRRRTRLVLRPPAGAAIHRRPTGAIRAARPAGHGAQILMCPPVPALRVRL